MSLRPYQQEAHDFAIEFMRSSVDPCMIEAATGAGKSHIIAAVAKTIHDSTGKRVLCLAPSAELVTQNRAKYLASGHKASMFSASAGAKELRHHVVFGSPLTVKNKISRFMDNYALVIVDECHGITPTLKAIINQMREGNPNLRVLGLTATPYRLNEGYIFQQWPSGNTLDESLASNPYFMRCVYQISAPDLIDMGYLTPPVVGTAGADGYDTAGMTPNSRGKFDQADIDRAYHGHGRKTAAIVADVMAQTRNRQGVMFFAATVQHANEIMASLPPGLSAIVTGQTKAKERKDILRRFLAKEIKYLVNVSVLTTGFDAPHVDCIAILRKTESVGLLQQIIGRGLRLDDWKENCLILDYTSNLDDHCPDGDLFAPVVQAKPIKEGGKGMRAVCPQCNYENTFSTNIKHVDYKKDESGYCLDLDGNQIMTDFGPLPGHHGRRCLSMSRTGPRGEYERCSYRWTSKECPECSEPNDIAARYCSSCRAEIIDPNEKLRIEFKQLKRTPTQWQVDEVVSMTAREGISRNGNKTVRADIVTPWRSFSVWFTPESNYPRQRSAWEMFEAATPDGETPRTVTYKKDRETGFYQIRAWNEEPDHEPE